MATLSSLAHEGNLLLPVLPLRDVCLFPEASLAVTEERPAMLRALEVASRTGGRLLALAQKDGSAAVVGARGLEAVGTLATIDHASIEMAEGGGRRFELDGHERARVVTLLGGGVLVAEAQLVGEGDSGDDWGGAVEALARYLHAHSDLRKFLDAQRRSREPMSWVNLACQHLPITLSARQKLLEAHASDRCQMISRGLEALLRKEKGS